MTLDDQSSLERFAEPESIHHDDGLRWYRRSLLEGGGQWNPNAKHLASMNADWRREHGLKPREEKEEK